MLFSFQSRSSFTNKAPRLYRWPTDDAYPTDEVNRRWLPERPIARTFNDDENDDASVSRHKRPFCEPLLRV